MNELDLLRAAPDPGQPAPETVARHQRELRRVIAAAGLPEPSPQRKPRRSRVLVPLAVGLAIATVAGMTLGIVNRRDTDDAAQDRTQIVTSDDLFGGRSTPSGASHPPLFLVPRSVPEGFALLQASGTGHAAEAGTIRSGSPEIDRIQRWVRLDAARERPVELLEISWGPGVAAIARLHPELQPPSQPTGPVDLLESYRDGSVTVTVRGRVGFYSVRKGVLAWEEPRGQVVRVSARTPTTSLQDFQTEPLSRELIMGVAEGLVTRAGGGFDLSTPPTGFELAGEWSGLSDGGTNPRVLIYKDPFDRGFRLQLVDDTGQPPGMSLSFANTRLVDVRGRTAVVGPHLSSANMSTGQLFLFGADQNVQWLEPDGTRVTLSGVGITEPELLAIARSLEPVDEQTWLNLQSPPPVGPTLPSAAGPPPADEAAARQAVIEVFGAANNSGTPLARRITLVDDPAGLRDAYREAASSQPEAMANYRVEIHDVRFLSATEAAVRYDLVAQATIGSFPGRTGRAVFVDGEWKVSRSTVCGLLSLAQATCAP